MQSPEAVVKIPELIQIASKYIRTDMNIYQLTQLASFGKSIDLASVHSASLPGRPSKFGRVSYWILDTEKSQEIINKLIYREDSSSTIPGGSTISILYNKMLTGRAAEIKAMLQEMGYQVVCDAPTKDPHNQLISHSSTGSSHVEKLIKGRISELKDAPTLMLPDRYPCGRSDYTIVLAGN